MATNNNTQPGPIAQQLTKLQSNGHQAVTPQLNGQQLPVKKDRWGLSGKTFWDWLPLFIQLLGAFAIPISLFALYVSISQFNEQQKYDSQKTGQQNQVEFQNLKDQQQQSTLDTYFDRISDLLLSNNLNSSQAGIEVRALARARNITALRGLDSVRKGTLLEFLHESDLIGYETYLLVNGKTQITIRSSTISLIGADLSHIELKSLVDLSGSDLAGTNLEYATLYDVNLDRADLLFADLYGANLRHAELLKANLKNATLEKAILFNAFLEDADLSGANLENTNLSDADLKDANLSYSDLSGADLTGANLSSANLRGNTGLTKEQLAQVFTLKGAVMPDGSIHP